MYTVTVTFDDHDEPARITRYKDVGHVFYDFGDYGTVCASGGFYLQPERRAVTVTLGSPGDKSGYHLTGLDVGDWGMTGIVMCAGYEFTPYPHPHAPDRFPLADIDDAEAHDQAASLLSQIARHYYDLVN